MFLCTVQGPHEREPQTRRATSQRCANSVVEKRVLSNSPLPFKIYFVAATPLSAGTSGVSSHLPQINPHSPFKEHVGNSHTPRRVASGSGTSTPIKMSAPRLAGAIHDVHSRDAPVLSRRVALRHRFKKSESIDEADDTRRVTSMESLGIRAHSPQQPLVPKRSSHDLSPLRMHGSNGTSPRNTTNK